MEKWLEPKTITIWIIIIALLVFVLTLSLIALAYLNFRRMLRSRLEEARLNLDHQKKLLETSVSVQEKERIRIAADLHDTLIGKMMNIRFKNHLRYDPQETDHLLGEMIAEARRISHDLSPPMIEYKTMAELIEDLVIPWKKNFQFMLINDVRIQESIPGNMKLQFVRIIQELITNASKHAKAGNLFIHLRHTAKWLILRVGDDGCGFDRSDAARGLGFYNIELRMQQLDGHYKIKSEDKKGVSAVFVLHNKQTI